MVVGGDGGPLSCELPYRSFVYDSTCVLCVCVCVVRCVGWWSGSFVPYVVGQTSNPMEVRSIHGVCVSVCAFVRGAFDHES